jgi:hypothetical protein
MKTIKEYFNLIIIEKDEYTPLTDNEYYKRFGIEPDSSTNKLKVTNEKFLEKAYSKAWENRDFEIDKFWTRAAYFWGFIVLIFGGYITILTGEHTEKALNMHLDLYLLLLGVLFSISWYLVILGSKTCNAIGKLILTVWKTLLPDRFTKQSFILATDFIRFKLNEVMAVVVIIVWCGLLGQYLDEHYSLTIGKDILWTPTIAIGITLVFATVLIFGYSSGSFKSTKGKFIDRWE